MLFRSSRTGTALLEQEAAAAESLGIRASFETDCELPFPVAGVTMFARQARFHPLKFLAEMAEEVEVYEQSKVLKVDDRKVETDRGTVTAKHVVFASSPRYAPPVSLRCYGKSAGYRP